MSPLNSAALTAGVVATGTVANGHGITFKYVLGSMFYTVALVALTSANQQLGSMIGTLVLVAAIMAYVPTVAKKIGLVK